MKVTRRQLRRIIREALTPGYQKEPGILEKAKAYDTGREDFKAGKTADSYNDHDDIVASRELTTHYARGFDEGNINPHPGWKKSYNDDKYKDMDMGTRGLPGVHGVD